MCSGLAVKASVSQPRATRDRKGSQVIHTVRGITSLVAAALLAPTIATAQSAPRRPNIVVILGDDLGFADMGMFGGEIQTPNLDALAREGVRFTNFYTNASCSPTCATFLSGVDTHLNGLGNMDEWTAPNQQGLPGYEGYLNNRVGTLPQFLKGAGSYWDMTNLSAVTPRRGDGSASPDAPGVDGAVVSIGTQRARQAADDVETGN